MRIHKTAIVHKKVKIGKGVSIGPYTIVGENVEIGDDCFIGPHVFLDGWTKIGKNCKILGQSAIGAPPQYLEYKGEETRVIIGENNIIREFVTINRGTKEGGGITRIGNNNFIMAYSHIAHDCQVGNGVTLANVATLAGHVTVEDCAIIGGLAAIHQYVRIGAYAMIGGLSPVRKDIIPYVIGAGDPLRVSGINVIGLKRNGFSRKEISILKEAFRLIIRSKLNLSQAVERIEKELEKTDSIKHLLEFLRTSKRGICK
ncbi:MAG TPA: acyl-ACP--UDP-N-acetylglucosamine O-acyltransferase [bacterium]|nr:acyl-ACP--UDP-N-acetylglucosamine O-acyltransferase [bacterium]